MNRTTKKQEITFTIILVGLLVIIYYFLEYFFYSDFGCGCSSGCVGYYPVMTSRITGYLLMITSAILFISSIWRLNRISRWWTIPALLVFGIALYGNGYMVFNKRGCGYSLNKTTFFINQTNLGDFAKADGETVNLDSLKAGRYNGKLLGYRLNGNKLTVFRIGAPPLVVETSFLFWKVRGNVILNDLSYSLNTLRNIEAEISNKRYEFIGGQGMKEEDFITEFVLTNKELTGRKLKNKSLTNKNDGTMRFLFEID